MYTYYFVTEDPEGFFVEVLTERSRAPKVASGPWPDPGSSWDMAQRLATSAASRGLPYYTTLPSDLCAIADPEHPCSRACWVVWT
jgi:hypothetical protein